MDAREVPQATAMEATNSDNNLTALDLRLHPRPEAEIEIFPVTTGEAQEEKASTSDKNPELDNPGTNEVNLPKPVHAQGLSSDDSHRDVCHQEVQVLGTLHHQMTQTDRKQPDAEKKMTQEEEGTRTSRSPEANPDANIGKLLQERPNNVARMHQETRNVAKRTRIEPPMINSSNFINPHLLEQNTDKASSFNGSTNLQSLREERSASIPVGFYHTNGPSWGSRVEITRNFPLRTIPAVSNQPIMLIHEPQHFRCVSEARIPMKLPVKIVKNGLGLNSLQPHMMVPPFVGKPDLTIYMRGRRSNGKPTYQRAGGSIPLIQTPESQSAILLAPSIRIVCSRGLSGSHEPWTLTCRFSGQNPNEEVVKGLVLIPRGTHTTGQYDPPTSTVLLDHLSSPLEHNLAERDIMLKRQKLSLSRAGPLDTGTIHVPVSVNVHQMVRTAARRAETGRDYARLQNIHLDTLGLIYYSAFDRMLVINMARRQKPNCLISGCNVIATEWTDLKVHLTVDHPMYKPWHCPRPGCSYDCLTLAQLLYHTRMIHSKSLKLILEERHKNCQQGCGYIQDTHDLTDYREHRALKHAEQPFICACCRLGYVDELAWIHHQWPSFTALARVEQAVDKMFSMVKERLTTLGRDYIPERNGEEKEIGIVGGNCQNFPNSIPL